MELNEFLIKEDIKKKYILDTSIIIKWYYSDNENDLDCARLFYDRVKNNQVIIVSLDIMTYELLNFFVFKFNLPEDKINEVLAEIYDIVFLISINKPIIEEACKVARILKNSIYDSSFVVLSLKLNYPLFTADKKLYNTAKSHGYNISYIADYQQYF
ncbi:MAG: type II toxin-antitoxin system VapC family toxin [Actinobacteria bacterium]|nr:type II toxin-antitoxin system VapC family toxin [Actinomycetota bacterium]MBM3712247.1 type II toxin-antitoxin system VapC family toxin [Actinomycetota bacterium]